MTDAPRKINLGSGKDYRERYCNVDIDPRWKPDAVLDIADSKIVYPPELNDGEFDEILANDVLEHLPDLVTAMTNCLGLLRVGGIMDIIVPYDLSLGAWSDPTHRHAFNERSWVYYTDWFWYMGWKTHRFMLQSLEYIMTPEGLELYQQDPELAVRTPRMVEAMHVNLVKVELSQEDKSILKSCGL